VRYRFFTCDVFTDTRFGGNQLAVHPEAEGLTAAQMQRVAREFNFSETTFVLPPEQGHDRRVRIFTPTQEVPFAGHPNIGTAFVLATTGALGPLDAPRTVTFEEDAGLVAVAIEPRGGGRLTCELRAPQRLSLGGTAPAEAVAAAIGLTADDIVATAHEPLVASVGLPFVIAELRDREALARAKPSIDGAEALLAAGAEVPDVHVYVRSHGEPAARADGESEARADDEFDARSGGESGVSSGDELDARSGGESGVSSGDEFAVRARMFSPLDGIPEDPATGSANCALAGLLGHLEPAPDGAFAWRIAQGVEMGRPSVLEARVEKRGGEVTDVWIGGESVLVSEGTIEVD